MSVEECAAFLGVDRKTVYDYAGRGQIPHRRLGRRILFSRAAVMAWLSACKSGDVGKAA
jgi:excisionase family DNA binding protein